MDTELFELCKEVERITGWQAPDTYKAVDGNPENDWQAYDSDYLLEKLPWSSVCSGPNIGMFAAWLNGKGTTTFQEADTPLKALLKLTIALHEAGELK